MPESVLLLLAVAYVGLLFGVAYVGDRRAADGRSLVSNPYMYALSMGVYCTAWTFYGSVGRAATTGIGYLPIYLGPTLVFLVGWIVVRKMIRISRHHRITSIADFIGSRYGKSALLAGWVTFVAVVGVVPYIALQVKAIAISFAAVTQGRTAPVGTTLVYDTALWMSIGLAAFTILFGTRNLDATERHEGMVAAIAFESIVKLIAFLAVGGYVVFGLYDGPADLFSQGAQVEAIRALYTADPSTHRSWTWLIGLSMLAVLTLPRQFQVAVVENVDETHVRTASWLFPLYLLAINLFVFPIAVAGLLTFGDPVQADTFVVALPMAHGQSGLAVLAFLGGFSAATGMVIVAATALSTMISNDLVMPVLLRIRSLQIAEQRRLPGLILGIRRASIIVVLLLAYVYVRTVGGAYTLVSIGLISFAAVGQFAPALLGGMYWKRATRAGALTGLIGGFLVWGYTLPLGSLAETGWLPASFVTDGPLGIELLKPHALLGLTTLDPIAHGTFWSLLVNTGLYVGVSLFTTPRLREQHQAAAVVDVFRLARTPRRSAWRGTAQLDDLRHLLQRYLGWRRTQQALQDYARMHDLDPDTMDRADEKLMAYVERLLAGVIGTASARVVVASVVQEQPLHIGDMMHILDETQQVIAYSRELEHKKTELEQTTRQLKAANHKLKRVDRMKDDFVATVTHELRTPLTAIRAITEILQANPDLDGDAQKEFVSTIARETERLTRLVNQVLDLQRLEASGVDRTPLDIRVPLQHAADAMRHQMEERGQTLSVSLPEAPVVVAADADRLLQVIVNLLSNATKFANTTVALQLTTTSTDVRISVADDGPGIPPEEQDAIFEKFRQVDHPRESQAGSGLGLSIARQIIQQHAGGLSVESTPGEGATFIVHLPASDAAAHAFASMSSSSSSTS